MSQPFAPGSIIDEKYRVERELGIGGMGFVIQAFHMGLEERVAVKMLLPDALGDAEAVARFSREAKAAARIKSEHVARVLDVSTLENGTPYIVMEYLEGSDLEQIVEARGPLSIEDAVDYVLQSCEALAEAHARGIVHRDLKPGNLHLSNRADGSPLVKVLDFGISKVATRENDGSVTTTSALLGSPLYMSPEQMKATRDVDGRSDIWAMGVVLYELLTNRSPFTAPSMPQVCARVLETDPDPFPPEAEVPDALAAVVMRCLHKNADERFQDVGALAAALAPFAPPRSMICIERIAKVIESPPTNTSMRLCPGGSRSAPTVDEADIIEAQNIEDARKLERPKTPATPLPVRIGAETLTNATLSAAYAAIRPRKSTVAYGAGALAFLFALFYVVHSHDVASANQTTSIESAIIPPAAVARIEGAQPQKQPYPTTSRKGASAAFVASPVAHADLAPPETARAAESARDSSPPPLPTSSVPTSSGRAHHRAQDMSKYFGGRD